MRPAGVGLGQLLLALDATMVRLVDAPRGLDLTVASATLIDSDDVRLGLAADTDSVDLFFLLGVSEAEALTWVERRLTHPPVAVFVKEPSAALVDRAVAAGIAVVAVEPRARWERLYRLVNHVFEHRRDPVGPFDSDTDLFGLAQAIADRVHGMVSIEDAQSHVLAYSASEQCDELRRLSILGRAGPAEHLQWLARRGIFDALRTGSDVVRVAARPESGLQPRLAIGVHSRSDDRRRPDFLGTIWVQQGAQPLADDADEVLRGAAVLVARIMARLAARPSAQARRVQQLLGLADDEGLDAAVIAAELGVLVDGCTALIGFQGAPADVIALSASAFRPDAQVASVADRVYVVLPQAPAYATVASWVKGTVAALHRELGLELRAVIAGAVSTPASARAGVDRVLDSAGRHPSAIRQVTSVEAARTTVLLDEIVDVVGDRLVDPRVRELREHEPALAQTLRAYLDSFGDIAAAAAQLHVHPNTVRYRVRRIEQTLATSLADPDVRLVLSLSLRATA